MKGSELTARQKAYFDSGATRPLPARLAALERLGRALADREAELARALREDLNKQPMESYFCETGLVLEEIRFHRRHLAGWMKPRRVRTPPALFPARSFICPEPYGRALIMSPWNYPVQLCLSPLVGAISAGCCAVIKPSAYAPATSAAIARLVGDIFPEEYITVVEGGRAENQALLEEQFDYIFFTGSVAVGKEVMSAAARRLTPVTLELGGKSPVIVDKSADLRLAARRIAFGKVLNAGQTCVAPDYLLIHSARKEEFVKAYQEALEEFFPGGDYSQMPCIVNEKHYRRLLSLLEGQNIRLGGGGEEERRFLQPTLLDQVSPEAPVMQEEIFGPILPVLTFEELEEAAAFVRERPRPLALYLFTRDKGAEGMVLDRCSFGGGCINDTIMHLATSHLPFGGVGSSGMGSYHGKASFDTFTHYRSVVKKGSWPDLSMRYHPYTEGKWSIVRRILR